jgi:mevalonate kinase
MMFEEAQRHLTALGLGSPGIQRLRRVAREAGAFGAKSTGAGGGGAVIAIGHADDVTKAWRAEGLEAYVVEVGAP